MDLSFIMSVLEKCFNHIPKKCERLELILENFYKAMKAYGDGCLDNCINEVLNIFLANSDHNKGLHDLKELEFQRFKKEDKKDLNEMIKFADLLVDYENLSKSYKVKYKEKEVLLNRINQQRKICGQIYLKRIDKKQEKKYELF